MSKIQEIKGLAQTNIKLIKDSMDVSQKLLLDLVKLYPAGMSMYNNFMGEADYIATFKPAEFSINGNDCKKVRLTGFTHEGHITYVDPDGYNHYRCLISEISVIDAPNILINLIDFLTPKED